MPPPPAALPRVAWLELPHGSLEYYDALRTALAARGWSLDEVRLPRANLSSALASAAAVILGFGWMAGEAPTSRKIVPIPEFSRGCDASREGSPLSRPGEAVGRKLGAGGTVPRSSLPCFCGEKKLLVLLNKEYTLMREKMSWLRAHCVTAAFSVHHDLAAFEQASGVPFYRISFGVDFLRFSAGTPPGEGGTGSTREAPREPFTQARSAPAQDAGDVERESEGEDGPLEGAYECDLGFTGVVRGEQTANWRYRIWRESWPRLRARGVRLYSGERGGVHVGVAHAELNASEYVRRMRSCKAWLSTTGPADLVGTRYFEVMATGTTLLLANRMVNSTAYSSLGLVEDKHLLMFSTLSEFEEVVVNITKPSFDRRRRAIVARAHQLACHRFSWFHIAFRIEQQLLCVVNKDEHASQCYQEAKERHHYRVDHTMHRIPYQDKNAFLQVH